MAKKENTQASDDKKRFQEYNAEGAEFSEIYKIIDVRIKIGASFYTHVVNSIKINLKFQESMTYI